MQAWSINNGRRFDGLGLARAPAPFRVSPDKGLCQERAKRINRHIPGAGFPSRHKQLMEFVDTGKSHGNKECEKGPIKTPPMAIATNPMKNRHAEDTEFSDMSELTNTNVHEMDHMARS